MPSDFLPPVEPLPGHRSISQIFAYFAGNRGVVGNTTFAFWAAMLAAILLGVGFTGFGYPGYGLIAIGLVILAYFGFSCATWVGVGKYPDAAVTGENEYARIVLGRIRHAAKDPKIIENQPPVVGTSKTTAALLGGSPNGGR